MGAAVAGTADGLVIAAFEDPTWATDLIGETLRQSDVSQVLIGMLLSNRMTLHWGRAFDSLFENTVSAIDGVAGDLIQNGLELGAGEAIGGLAMVADAHIPVVTIVRALARANRAQGAGLEGDRVMENLAWDVGGQGGGIAAGALIGTAIFPGVGTVIGALLGGLGGKAVADEGKLRHLRNAERRAMAKLEDVGLAITRDQWLQIAQPLAWHVGALEAAQRDLALVMRQHRRIVLQSFAYHVMVAAADVGRAETAASRADLDAWWGELDYAYAYEPAEFRALQVMVRPDLRSRLAIRADDARVVADNYRRVAEEREKLNLANGR